MSRTQATAAALGAEFLAAAIEPTRWVGALSALADATRSNHAQLVGIGPDYATDFNWISGLNAGQQAAFGRNDLHLPTQNFRVAARGRLPVAPAAPTLIHEGHYRDARRTLTSEDYLDLCRDWQIWNGAQIDVRADDSGLIGLALLRSDKNGVTNEEDRALMAAVRAPIAAAIDLQVALEHQGHKVVAGSFEAMSAACFVLDRRRRVRALTPATEPLLRDGVVRVVDGRLLLGDRARGTALDVAIGAVEDGALSRRVVVQAGSTRIICQVKRLPAQPSALGFAPFAVVIVRQLGARRPIDVDLLRDTFGFTPVEAEIAAALAAGISRAEIEVRRKIGAETLRSHMRAVYAKLGVSKETQAIHLLHTLTD